MQSKATVKQDDKQAIREMVDTWLEASKRGDLTTLLNLLADDVLFIVPGKEPFGKEAFAKANQEQMKDVEMDATIDIKEIESARISFFIGESLRSCGIEMRGSAALYH